MSAVLKGLMTLMFILTACAGPESLLPTQPDPACLPAHVKTAFPIESQSGQPIDRTPAPVPDHWELKLSAQQAGVANFAAASVVAKSSEEIWMTGGAGSVAPYLLRYRPMTGELYTYTVAALPGIQYVPNTLYLSKRGELWGMGRIGVDAHSTAIVADRFPWMLSKYDEKSDQFIPIQDEMGILVGRNSSSISEDSQGVLWLLAGEGLISYDPISGRVQTHDGVSDDYSLHDLAIANGNAIWLSANQSGGQWEILQFDPQTSIVRALGTPPNVDPQRYPRLHFDRTGRLWVDNVAWAEQLPAGDVVWYEIIRPAVFVAQYPSVYGQGQVAYGWSRPGSFFESSNGSIWLSTANGLVTFDSETEEWCLIYDGRAVVDEDESGYLWIVTDKELYRYPPHGR